MRILEHALIDACMNAVRNYEITGVELESFEPFIHRHVLETEDAFYFPGPSRNSKDERLRYWDDLMYHPYRGLTPYSPLLGCGTGFEYIPGFGNEVWWTLSFNGGEYEPLKFHEEWLPVTDEFATYLKNAYAEEIQQWLEDIRKIGSSWKRGIE